MSAQQQRTELLIFGHSNEIYDGDIPDVINHVIQLFYDDYFYWRVQNDQMKQFVNAKNGDIIHCSSTFKIKGIEFECTLCPAGWKEDNAGNTEIYLEVKHKPSNIQYFRLSVILNCETTKMTLKFMKRWWLKSGNGKGFTVCKKSDYQDRDHLDFNCKVDILSIKYEQEQDAEPTNIIDDYIFPIKMSQYNKYEWIINDKSEMEKMKSFSPGMPICSDNFGCDNNWTVLFFPKGFRRDAEHPGAAAVDIWCLRLPFGITGMTVEYGIKLESKCSEDKYEMVAVSERNSKWIDFHHWQNRRTVVANRLSIECPDVDIHKLLDQDWIKVTVTVEIVDVYKSWVDMVARDCWDDIGIIVSD